MGEKERCPREKSESLEPEFLEAGATKSTDHPASDRQYPIEPDQFRTAFERDYTRILHSRAFRRLRHKTQVFVDPRNDHICTRLEHSLYVASVSRTISKALGLNNDLVAAISLGHDLGHAPFGHEGEKCLQELANQNSISFQHELHSLRVIDKIERMYPEHPGLNLTFAVRDGIACHCGEKFEQRIAPDRNKRPKNLNAAALADRPATTEGCVVRFADKIAYLGRDLEDAITVGILTRNKIPDAIRNTLGRDNSAIIGAMIGDVIQNSDDNGIAMSDKVHQASLALKSLNEKRIYSDPKVVRSRFGQIEKAMRFMFDELLNFINEAKSKGSGSALFCEDKRKSRNLVCLDVLHEFLATDIQSWETEKPAQLVVDFIAGMTDSFFIRSFEELFLPRSAV
ncbi:MAG TPA: dNTP triphosphohydrolase [Phycisphaerae bacterium]|nr:dNTP triphosphohydrolase [Phycisphaerae bacterium]